MSSSSRIWKSGFARTTGAARQILARAEYDEIAFPRAELAYWWPSHFNDSTEKNFN